MRWDVATAPILGRDRTAPLSLPPTQRNMAFSTRGAYCVTRFGTVTGTAINGRRCRYRPTAGRTTIPVKKRLTGKKSGVSVGYLLIGRLRAVERYLHALLFALPPEQKLACELPTLSHRHRRFGAQPPGLEPKRNDLAVAVRPAAGQPIL